jgi:membrane protein DedA with SNARE-associated domain
LSPELLFFSYVGIFGLSLGSSLIVFVPLPYLAVILALALSGRFDSVLIIIACAAGSAVGKFLIYQACYSGQTLVNAKTKANLRAFRSIFAQYAWIAVFVAASTPIPDDVVYVPLGFARYNRFRFFTATLTGKIVLVSVIVYGAGFFTNTVFGQVFIGSETAGVGELIAIGVVFAALTILATYFIARFDWVKWIEKHFSEKVQKP